MKHFYSKCKPIFTGFGFVLFLIAPIASFAQLSGSYTIDPSASASSTNYTNWASAISDLVSGTRSDGGTAQGSGVSGAVTFTVADRVYSSTSLSLNAITGTSSSNTITFKSKGGDSSQCIVRQSSGGTNDYVLQLNGADYITFENIGFERTGTNVNSTVVRITNGSDNNTITNCWLKGRKVPSNSSNGFAYAIGSIVYFAGSGGNNTIQNSKLLYGYNGVFSTSSATGNEILNNVIDTSGSSGVYMTNQTDLKIIGNEFNMGDFGPGKGHYTSYGMRIESSPGLEISKNKIQMLAINGQVVRAVILANLSGTSTNRSLVSNNFVLNAGGTGDCTGFAVYNCLYVDFYSNNVLITNSLKAGSAYYHYANYTNSNIRLVNNNLVNKGGGYVYNVPGTNTADLASIDYNNAYTTGTKFGQWNGTDYNSFTAWKSGSRKDTNSVSTDPGFSSNKDLHVSNIGLNGQGVYLSSVLDDIDGETRSTTTPDIGADEFFPANLDAGVSKIDSPAAFCAGTSNVKVIFQNYGITTLTKLDIHWEVNGVSQKTYSWTGSVASGNSSSSILLGNYTFLANTAYSFKIWTDDPNGNSDGKNVNDTLSITRQPGLTGKYTIGTSSSADYGSFSDAITAMTARGICGATTFEVEDGTYREQITLVQLDGMGASNPVVFEGKSKDSSKVVVTLPTTTATGNNNAAVQLRGADNTTFKHITFERTGTNPYGHVVHILNGSHNNTFSNCQMIAPVVTTANANSVNIWSEQGVDTGNTFLNNYVQNGYFNMLFGGFSAVHEKGTVVKGNVFGNAYGTSVQISFTDGLLFEENILDSVRTAVVGNADLRLFGCDNNNKVLNNRFRSGNTDVGLLLDLCIGTASEKAVIANNTFVRRQGIGILIDQSDYQQVVFNNLNFTGTSSSSIGIGTSSSTSQDIELLNNCVRMKNGKVYDVYLRGYIGRSDHNNLYTLGNTFAEWNGNTYNDLQSFARASRTDSHSVSVDPFYTSAKQLNVSHPALYNAGTPVGGITVDMDGDTRTSIPDIGSDEFTVGSDDASISAIVSPINQICEGTYEVKVVIRNLGNNDLSSANIGWELKGVAQTGTSWTGKLANRETDTVSLGNVFFQGGAKPVLAAWTSSPNGKTDGFGGNDTFELKVTTSILPTETAGGNKKICVGDSVQLGIIPTTNRAYLWLDANNDTVGTLARVYVKPNVTEDFYFTITNTRTGCANHDTVEVTVFNYPVADAGPDAVLCEGDTIQLGATSVTTDEYEWTSRPANFVSTTAQPEVSPAVNTTYFLEQTTIGSKCSSTDSVRITVSPVPVASIIGALESCEAEAKGYKTVDNGNTLDWTAMGGTILDGAGTDSININWMTTGSGQVKLVESNAYCSDSITINIDVHENPTAAFESFGNCVERPIEFTDVTATSKNRSWDFGDGQSTKGKNVTNVFATAGEYTVTLSVETDKGCVDTLRKSITTVDIPVVVFEIPTTTCEQNEIAFTNNSTGADGYTWRFGDGNTSTDQDAIHTYAKDSLYRIELVADNKGCRDSLNRSIIIDPLPDASFTAAPEWYDVKFAATNTTANKYAWDFGDGETSDDQEVTHTYNIPDSKEMTVSLTVTSKDGCSSTTTQQVYVVGTSIEERLPKGVQTLTTYPNPFTQNTTVELSLDQAMEVEVTLFDIRGRAIATLLNPTQAEGKLQVNIDGGALHLAPGSYLVRITLNQEHVLKQIIDMQ